MVPQYQEARNLDLPGKKMSEFEMEGTGQAPSSPGETSGCSVTSWFDAQTKR